MKVAITGANGFFGAYLVKAFLKENFSVFALIRAGANLDNLPTEHQELRLAPIDYGQDLDPQIKLLKEKHQELDLFIHNAGVTVSLDPAEYFEINFGLAQKILSSVEANNWVKNSGKVVYISSLTAQGPDKINLPVSKYGESKLKAEALFEKSRYHHLIIRPTAIYGAGDYAFLPLLKGAKNGLYPVTNAAQKMSMIHASDLAEIVLKESERSVGILHATDGETYTHDDLINSLQKVLQRRVRKIPVPAGLSKFILGLSDLW
ncbi:MAG: SDR family NAD(P)-dependent oxidoreductase, partial [Bacteroidota bacterium]